MKHIPLHLMVITIFALTVITCQSEKPGAKNAKQKLNGLRVQALIVSPSFLNQSITVSGTLKPFEETVLMPEVPGRVVSINLQEGKEVKKGTVLVALFNGDLQAQLQKSQAQLKIAEETLNRQSELIKISGISQSDYDQAQLQVSSIKADIEIINVQIGRTRILAPFDGTVGLRNISLGAQVTPSTALVTIRDVKKLKIDFSVPEKYSSKIKAGSLIKFTVQGDNKNYNATVMATEQSIESNTRNLNVRAVIKELSTSLVPGAFAIVSLQLDANNHALLVPTQAVIPNDQNKNVIIARNGKVHFTKVVTGLRMSSKVEITEGIQAGDTIITSGILFLKEGSKLFYSNIIKNPTL